MSGRLVFMRDMANVIIDNNQTLSELVSGCFSPHLPSIQVQEGKITIGHHDSSCIDPYVSSHLSQAEIKLNPLIPWEIEIHSNIASLDANLRGLKLRSLDLLGSVSQIRLLLSRPTNTSFIYITGGIHAGSIHVPPHVGIRVRVSKTIANLMLGNRQSSGISGEAYLENADFKRATGRYDITIAGETSNMTIEQ